MKRKPGTYIGNGCGKLAKITFKNGEEYALRLSRLGEQSKGIAKRAIYDAANIVANEIRANIDTIQRVHRYQKADLKKSLGITPMDKSGDGYWNAKIGFDGYGSVPTKKYPKGIPNQLLARSIESGTSFRDKTPFVRRAVAKTKNIALQKMRDRIDEDIKKIMEE